ncbi:hydrogenase maturation protein HypF [Clostridium pascui]|uniref:carbamoyltransferase HypF n=1 Tax=Clostridium pascui TaxID=46609 RepID=UPI00195E821D|nr:carbamoyltransferase HypF [Clostridium pascui]MBM7869022.1 hydrogenase maturation protein HypF [Clostridium pascui]
MKDICRKYVVVTGIVQGVGFRPFVYNTAMDNELKGWVKNTSEGVYIDLEGTPNSIELFLHTLRNEAPPLSKINNIAIEHREVRNYKEFSIEKSDDNDRVITLISPDVATCKECEMEIMNSKDKRFHYPFTNCTNCGPRFSIIKKLPYDRPMTTMEKFNMCPHCNEEYENPRDRRFHAQPNACESCGPRVYLTDRYGNEITTQDPIEETKNLIKEGKIIAIKGLGGLHIACDGKNEGTIKLLRERKSRPSKPFALMMKDIDTVKQYCLVNEIEENTLKGIKRPILLLDVKDNILPFTIAPNNNRLGVMLPYTPLHHLLFDDNIDVLVMTSANVSGLPIVYKNEEAVEKLGDIVDCFLLNNRDIHVPIDDSVARVILGEERIIRRSRGYAPMPIKITDIKETLAYGSHLKNAFCISKEQFAFLSQHMGDMDNLEAYKNYEYNVKHFKNLYNIKPEIIAYDMHPDLLLSNFAKKDEGKKIPVQHHHAHLVSCMIENKINEKVIGIAFDGTGFGTDGKIWGGEFLVCNYEGFERAGHLNYVKMPGGDSAVKEPWKMALGYLFKTYRDEVNTSIFTSIPEKNIKIILTMLRSNINSIETSSMGRFFDAISALINLKMKVSFEGEAAINLEAICDERESGIYNYEINFVNETYVVNTDNIIKSIVEDIAKNINKSIIAKRFHNTVIAFTLEMTKLIRSKHKINSVALSGGVFQNEILLKRLYEKLIENNFKVYIHKDIPCNDGGISIGQLVIANYKEKNMEE